MYTAPVEEKAGRTVAKQEARALPAAEALAYIAKDDPRPLLVLRECKVCNGTDDALLSRGNVDNEKTFLLARWFHCVKLPVDVLEESHPFHELFLGKSPEHMFLASTDGLVRIPLESERSRTELWGAMLEVLKATYAKAPDTSLRKMEKTVDDFDQIDERIAQMEKRADDLLESEGPDSKKWKKLNSELEEARQERDKLFHTIDQATAELKLKKVSKAEPASDETKGG